VAGPPARAGRLYERRREGAPHAATHAASAAAITLAVVTGAAFAG